MNYLHQKTKQNILIDKTSSIIMIEICRLLNNYLIFFLKSIVDIHAHFHYMIKQEGNWNGWSDMRSFFRGDIAHL